MPPAGHARFDEFDVVLPDPDSGLPITVHQVRQETMLAGTRTWVGRTSPESFDQLILTVSDGAVGGLLRLGHRSWRVEGPPSRLTLTRLEDRNDNANDTAPAPLALSSAQPAPAVRAGFTTGPYADAGLPVIDLLIVYASALYPPPFFNPFLEINYRHALVSDVVDVNEMLMRSRVQGRIRLVGIERIEWDPQTPSKDGLGLDAGAALNELTYHDGPADEVFALREQYGADLVVGVAANFGDNIAGLSWAATYPGPGRYDLSYLVVDKPSTSTTLAHEIGHQLGVHHWRDAQGTDGSYECENNAGKPSYAYGFVYPTERDLQPDPYVCPTNGHFTLMGNRPYDPTLLPTGVELMPDQYTEAPVFANPDLHYFWTCDDGTPMLTPSGSTVPNTDIVSDPADGCTAAAAWRMSETFGAVADYHPARPGLLGAELVSPTPGSNLLTGATFSWNAVAGATGRYWIEVYRPSTGSVIYDHMVQSTVATVNWYVGGLPTAGVVGVRLWTEVSTDRWLYKEYRYNSMGKAVSCSDEDPGLAPDAHYASFGCGGCAVSTAYGYVCCSGSVAGTSGPVEAYAASDFAPGDAYDVALWGTRSNGDGFCCLVHDPLDQLSLVLLAGLGVARRRRW